MRTPLVRARAALRAARLKPILDPVIRLLAQFTAASRPMLTNAWRTIVRALVASLHRIRSWTVEWLWPRLVEVAALIRRWFPVVVAAIARFGRATAWKIRELATIVARIARRTYARSRHAYGVLWVVLTAAASRAARATWRGSVRATAATSAGLAASWRIFVVALSTAGRAVGSLARTASALSLRGLRRFTIVSIGAGRTGVRLGAAGLRHAWAWTRRARVRHPQWAMAHRNPATSSRRVPSSRTWAHPFAALATRIQPPDWLRAPAWTKSTRLRHPFAELRFSPAELLQTPDWIRKPGWLTARAQRERQPRLATLRWSFTPEWLRKPAWLTAPKWLRKPAWLVAPSWLRTPPWLAAINLRRNIIGPAIAAMVVILAAVFTAVVYSTPRTGAAIPDPLVAPTSDNPSSSAPYLSAPAQLSTAPGGVEVVVQGPGETTEPRSSVTARQSAQPGSTARASSIVLPITYPIYVFPVVSSSIAPPTYIFVSPTSPTTTIRTTTPTTAASTKTATPPATTPSTKTTTVAPPPGTTSATITVAEPPPVTTSVPPPVTTVVPPPVTTVVVPPPVTTPPATIVVPPPATSADPAPVTSAAPAPAPAPAPTTTTPDPITVLVGEILGGG